MKVTWEEFKAKIRAWVHRELTDDAFIIWLRTSSFASEADQRVADVFIKQHDEGNWSASYHHVNM